jgi:Peptidase family M48
MARYVVPIVLACIYVAGATWVVQREGQSYRDSLRPSKPEAGTAPAAPVEPRSDVDLETKGNATPKPTVPRPEPPSVKPISTPEIHPAPKRPEEKTEPPPPPASPPPSTTISPKPPPEAAAPPASKDPATNIDQWKNDPFWGRPELAKDWKLDHFTVQDEKQLGEQLNSLILQLNAEDRGSGLRRVRKAAEPLLKLVNPKDREYQFFVLNSEVANAFSHPGGYVYVSRKLLEMIPEDEEALLEFVLAHEIAHVELQHTLTCLNDPQVRKFSDGTLQKLYFLIIPYGYPDKLEYAADAWAYHKLKQLRRSEHECLKFLRILDNYAKAHNFDNHLRSHPAAYDRLNRLKELRSPARP